MYAPVIQKPITFEEFLAWSNGTGRSFELRDGFPMPISDPNAKHEDMADDICKLLTDHCKSSSLPYVPKRQKQGFLGADPNTG